jgi:hypothetical protein
LDLSKASRLDGSDVSVGIWIFQTPHVLTVHTFPLAFWTFRRLYISTVHTFPLVAMSWRLRLEGSHFSVVILDLSKALSIAVWDLSNSHLDGSDVSGVGPFEGLTFRLFALSIGILDHLKASHLDGSHLLMGGHVLNVSKACRLDGSYFSVGVYNLLKASHLDGSHFSVVILDLSKASCLNCSHFSVAHLSIGILDLSKASHLCSSRLPLGDWTSRRLRVSMVLTFPW